MPPGGAPSRADQYLEHRRRTSCSRTARPPGAQPLTAATAVPIGTIATGQRPAAQAQAAAAGRRAAAAPQVRGRPRTGPRARRGRGRGGVDAEATDPRRTRRRGAHAARPDRAGEVKNYVPVTDAMLRNPPPGDWLMARRNYQAWSYSPLTEITRDNVKDLKLAWVWAMSDDGGANQNDAARPQRHHVPRATRATSCRRSTRTHRRSDLGDTRSVPTSRSGIGSMRNIAIYEDKIILATTDARLVALDARNGKLVWETVIADRTQGLLEHQRSDRRARQGDPGTAGLRPLRPGPLLHQRLRRERPASSSGSSTRSRTTGEPGGDTLGQAARHASRRRRDLDHRQLRSRSRISPTGASRRPSRGCRRAAATRSSTRRSTRRRPSRSTSTTASSPGTSSTFPASRSTSTRCSSACSSTSAARSSSSRSARPASCGSSIARTGKFLGAQGDGLPERLRPHRSEDGRADLSRRHHRAAGRAVDSVVPEHRRRPQLAGDELSPADQRC